MSIIRQNISTRDWTIFSLERAKRPQDFKQKKRKKIDKEYVADCPFCMGNEHLTPKELLRIGEDGWDIRVVPNKFPALEPKDGATLQGGRQMAGPYLCMEGIGQHEVIVETPLHNKSLALMDIEEMENVVFSYKQRYSQLSKNEDYQLIIIFRNHGSKAGTSLEHPHSQLIATPFVPGYVRNRLFEAQRYYDDLGHCVYCEMLKYEIDKDKRIICQNDGLVAFAPYASVVPYNIMIIPKMHQSCFIQADNELLADTADILKTTLKMLYDVLEDPDYNYIIDSAPADKAGEKHYHWHIEILPRLNTRAGFEIGSGMYINTVLPEDCAKVLKENKGHS